MAASSITITLTKDIDGNAIRFDYNLVNLGVRKWFAIYVNDINVARFKTNNSGGLVGFLEPVPSQFYNTLLALGSFSVDWGDETDIPSSGVICGQSVEVEDSDNEGPVLVPNVGTWAVDVRHD